MPITVIIADDHRIVREGLKALLTSADIETVGEAADGWETIEQTRRLVPDVVVMDVSMPGLNGVDATRRIMSLGVSSRVLALSAHGSEQYIRDMLQAGAAGYLLKACAGDELIVAIRAIFAGQLYVSPLITGTVVADYLARLVSTNASPATELTGREREVLQMIAEGMSTVGIAERLSLSVKTVETHRQRIMAKLDIRTIAGLTKYSIRVGITSLGD
jgi:DNA-binding NarL/FixJ family response regulator